jgi:autotransporter strand-loop-strand O-heptosyltransferase
VRYSSPPALADGSAPAPAKRASQHCASPESLSPKCAYSPPAGTPTQQGPKGIRFDFNDGCRVALPPAAHPWRVRLSDIDTGNVLSDTEIESGRINSTKRYFVRMRLEIWASGDHVLSHDYAAADREVLIQFPVGTLGDALGWFPYAVKFRNLHGCRLTCLVSDKLIPLLRKSYPDITFVTPEDVEVERYYATYCMGLFFDDTDFVLQPRDFRQVGLHRTAGYILGVDPAEAAPRVALEDDTRPIPGPYVCIAVQSTSQAKYWNNPDGWREIVRFLKDAGYRVVCIDLEPVHGAVPIRNHMPDAAEDETGDRPLQERARWLKHADFFVGLSSGLAWLAWAVGTPVVMISGFTHPTNEFETPYRVINDHACNSCWNDVRHRFDHKDFMYCPRHKGTPRQFECTRLITAEHVKAAVRRIPGFGVQSKAQVSGRKRKPRAPDSRKRRGVRA